MHHMHGFTVFTTIYNTSFSILNKNSINKSTISFFTESKVHQCSNFPWPLVQL
jgi:uncharacterized protein with NAD-binding domain and iron-sulfur cluster